MSIYQVMPWSPLALLVQGIGLAWLSVWLLETGGRQRSLWRLALGAPIALYLVVVYGLLIVGA